MPHSTTTVPLSLRNWFVVHFALDVVFALPLLLAPEWLLPRLGWLFVDPVTSRLVAAAVVGFCVPSLVGRDRGAGAVRGGGGGVSNGWSKPATTTPSGPVGR